MLLHLSDHDLLHFLLDGASLRVRGIAGGLNLALAPCGEAHGKETEKVSILSLDLYKRLDGRLPFLDELADLVAGR